MKKIMNFQTFVLNEAQTFQPEQVKKAIKKDKRVSMILGKNPKFSDLANPKEFFETMKNLFLNNPEVIKYRKDTDSFSDWGVAFDRLRKIKPEDFTEENFSQLYSELKSFLKQINRRENLKVSTDVKKAIEEWINTSGRHNRSMDRTDIAEIDSIPYLKPSKPIKLYRGLMWEKFHMQDGRDGLKFVKAIRNNSDVVDYVANSYESWTSNKNVANKFAIAGPADSEFSAMMSWLKKGKDFIEGELGAVVMVLAQPEDVLADLSRINNRLNVRYEWEDEVVLKPGKYTVKIVKLYDKTGELKPQEFLDRLESGNAAQAA